MLLASKADDRLVIIQNTENSNHLVSFSDAIGHNYWPLAITFNPHKPVLATFGEDKITLRSWDVDAAAVLREQLKTSSVRLAAAERASSSSLRREVDATVD